MNVKPVLGGWEVPRIESMETIQHREFVELRTPGRSGSLFQDMNTAPTRIGIWGSLYGDEAKDEFLQEVRGKFQAGEPVTVVADIVTATEVQYVIIEMLKLQERGDRPDQFVYVMVLRESPPPPPPPDPLGDIDTGLLDDAGSLLDSVTGALDAIDILGSIPDISDPTPPLRQVLDGVNQATTGLDAIGTDLKALFGIDTD